MSKKARFTVLYIEDNEANRVLLELLLTRRPEISLSCAPDGETGLEMVLNSLPDLILVDITLPDINGYEVLDRLKSTPATANIPVVAVSGDMPVSNHDVTTFNFDKYLPKPIELGPFYATLDEFLIA